MPQRLPISPKCSTKVWISGVRFIVRLCFEFSRSIENTTREKRKTQALRGFAALFCRESGLGNLRGELRQRLGGVGRLHLRRGGRRVAVRGLRLAGGAQDIEHLPGLRTLGHRQAVLEFLRRDLAVAV